MSVNVNTCVGLLACCVLRGCIGVVSVFEFVPRTVLLTVAYSLTSLTLGGLLAIDCLLTAW